MSDGGVPPLTTNLARANFLRGRHVSERRLHRVGEQHTRGYSRSYHRRRTNARRHTAANTSRRANAHEGAGEAREKHEGEAGEARGEQNCGRQEGERAAEGEVCRTSGTVEERPHLYKEFIKMFAHTTGARVTANLQLVEQFARRSRVAIEASDRTSSKTPMNRRTGW